MRAVTLLALLSGCVNTIRFPPDLWSSTWWDSASTPIDTGADNRLGLHVVRGEATCDAEATGWTFRARTDGWIESARINLFRAADGASEEHRMRVVASDPEGRWDEAAIGPLPDQTLPEAQVPEVNTRFDCTLDASTLSFVVRIWDPDAVLAHCAVWGADPVDAVTAIRRLDPDVLALGGCAALGD